MRILVKGRANPNIRLWLPTGLVLNRLTALCIVPALEKQGIPVTYKQMTAFIKVMQEFKHRHPDWVLADVRDADGTEVYIKL